MNFINHNKYNYGLKKIMVKTNNVSAKTTKIIDRIKHYSIEHTIQAYNSNKIP